MTRWWFQILYIYIYIFVFLNVYPYLGILFQFVFPHIFFQMGWLKSPK